MNNNRLRILKIRAVFIRNCLRILSIIGFGFLVSCVKHNDPMAMYGIISSDFEFSGVVTDEIDQHPIPGIQVKLTTGPYDTTFSATNLSGTYYAYRYDTYENQNVKLIFTDIDSVQNGAYETKTVDVVLNFRDMNNSERKENVKLTPKE